MHLTPQQREVIRRCRQSVTWFLRNFGKVKHPSAGIIPFDTFSYQRHAIKCFRKHRMNIFRKCRQAGISKISGAFAAWFALFNSNKTILIVSRTDEDAMNFLRENILFIYNNLPDWMRELWKPIKQNEHEIVFPNGSRIRSLTSHPDVLRSNSSSLNIIDEIAFIQNADVMWAGGWSTLQHGGNVICISTTNGLGGWYWSTMTDAEAGVNQFNPIVVNWWDMDWVVEYTDPLSLQHMRIAPLDGKLDCKSQFITHPKYGRLHLDPNKYGPYWSPWLEEQYRALSDQGESWKFEQEVLASFVGSGNTVLSKEAIAHVTETVRDPESKVTGVQQYVHPVTGERDELSFDFVNPDEGFWIWEKPVTATKDKYRGKELIERGRKAHSYVMGVDIASGQAKDYSTIEVFDIDTMEQVAEFMARVLPREFIKFIDRIGRYYNTALTVVERNNGGNIIIDQLRHDIMYPNLWRKKDINDKPMAGRNKRRAMKVGEYGYTTSQSSKATINKVLVDNIRDKSDNGEGYKILSKRLLKQLSIYVRKRDRAGRDTMKTEAEEGSGNHDDLVMATGLALIAAVDAVNVNPANLAPTPSSSDFTSMSGPLILSDTDLVAVHKGLAEKGGPGLLIPMSVAPDALPEEAAQMQLDAFTMQLGGIPISQGKPLVVPKNYYFETK